jgi:hypothetical protein
MQHWFYKHRCDFLLSPVNSVREKLLLKYETNAPYFLYKTRTIKKIIDYFWAYGWNTMINRRNKVETCQDES